MLIGRHEAHKDWWRNGSGTRVGGEAGGRRGAPMMDDAASHKGPASHRAGHSAGDSPSVTPERSGWPDHLLCPAPCQI